MTAIELLDATLRDGSYAVDFNFEPEFVQELLRRLDSSGVGLIEIGHGLGIEAERDGAKLCNISLSDWVSLAQESLDRARWGFFAQPRFSRPETVAALSNEGMSFLRVGLRAESITQNMDYLRRVVDSCENVYLNLMKTSATDPEKIPQLLDGLPTELAGVYVVDSFGAMLPEVVRRYVSAVAEVVSVVGFHGHDNLGMANANSIAAVEAGATFLDGTLSGIGRGAGNAQLESIAAILELIRPGSHDYASLARHAAFCRQSLTPIFDDRSLQVLGGAIGVHSELFPEIVTLSTETNLDIPVIMAVAARLTRSCDEEHLRAVIGATHEL